MDAILYLNDLINYNLSDEILTKIINYRRLSYFIPVNEPKIVEIPFNKILIYGILNGDHFQIKYYKAARAYWCQIIAEEDLFEILQILKRWAIEYMLELPPVPEYPLKRGKLCEIIYQYLESLNLIFQYKTPLPKIKIFSRRKF